MTGGAWRFTTNPFTCLREWRWYAVVGRPMRPSAIVPACVRAGIVGLPLLLGPAAFPAALYDYPRPLYGVPYAGGYGFGAPFLAPGYGYLRPPYETPMEVSPPPPVGPVGLGPEEIGRALPPPPIAPSGSLGTYPYTPPPATMTEIAPPVPTPEPSSLVILGGALLAWLLVKGGRDA